jgi:uncharacterized protein
MPDNFDLSRSGSARDTKPVVPRFRSWLYPPGMNRGGLATLQFMPLYFAAGGLLFLVLWTVGSLLVPPGTPKLWGQFLTEVILAVSAIAPAFGMAAIENRPFGDYGLPGRIAFGRIFWTGALVGLLALSLLLLLLHFLSCLAFDGVILHGLRILKFGVFWAMFFLLVALFEEFAFLGYPLVALSQAIGFWPTALLSSVVFGYTHLGNAGETWVGALGAATLGLFFCFTVRRTGNLWFAVGLHASWDWAQSFFYGVPDSGTREPGHLLQAALQGPGWLSGAPVGPEGSVLVFVLIATLWGAFARFYPSGREAVLRPELKAAGS